jgi:hypothetical protein
MQDLTMSAAPAPNRLYPTEADYMNILERFALYSERGWNPNYLGDPQLGYFGDPDNGESGMRSIGNYIFTTSLLASDPAYDPSVSGVDQQTLLERAMACLNYMTRSHVTGDLVCGNSGKWGDAWQSAWWTTKMALGAGLIWHQLSPPQQADVERVVVFEASRHVGRIVPSGLAEDTKAEENAWDAEILATAIALFPQHENADRWRETLIEFCVNTLSVPQDRWSEAIVDGRPLHQQVYTTNVHSDFTLENHGACHFCYVASPLVSIAWSYYALLSSGQPIPDALFHHVKDLWDATKPTFLGNRFAYMGGKEWARYTYGLYFIVPALVMLQSNFADPDARTIEAIRVRTLADEQHENNDGSFFGQRVTRDRLYGQSAKYETDCYADLGLAYLLHTLLKTDKQATPDQDLPRRLTGRNIGQESGTCYVKTPRLFASFSWRTLMGPYPNALFIPAGMDDVAEWIDNQLLGRVEVFGVNSAVSIRSMKAVGEGFIVSGLISYRTRLGEAYVHHLHYEVIPERNLAIVENKFVAKSKLLLLRCEGLRLAVANDRFNGYTRQYQSDSGSAIVTFNPTLQANSKHENEKSLLDRVKRKANKLLDLEANNRELGKRWVNIDEKFGVIQLQPDGDPFNLRQEPGRNTPNGCLHYDILNSPKLSLRPQIRQPNDILLHTRFAIVAGTSAETEALANSTSLIALRA